MNIRSKDLNLLVVFYEVMSELSITKAAKKLHLSQPALSNALARLRSEFQDELFVRSSRGVTPTPRALELKDPIARWLLKTNLIYSQKAFDPQNFQGSFTIATNDYFEHLALPDLLPYLSQSAPQIKTIYRPTLGQLPKQELEQGMMDLAIAGYFGDLPEGFYQQDLITDTYACLVRKNHPKVQTKLTLKTYLDLEHILVSPQGDMKGVVDTTLDKKGHKRKIMAGVSSFGVPASIVAQSDYIVTLPARIASVYAKLYNLYLLKPPIEIPSIRVKQVWHQRTHLSPQHQWFREALKRIMDSKEAPIHG